MQEIRFPDISAQTTSADTYRYKTSVLTYFFYFQFFFSHPNLQLSRSKTTLHEPPANYQVLKKERTGDSCNFKVARPVQTLKEMSF